MDLAVAGIVVSDGPVGPDIQGKSPGNCGGNRGRSGLHGRGDVESAAPAGVPKIEGFANVAAVVPRHCRTVGVPHGSVRVRPECPGELRKFV